MLYTIGYATKAFDAFLNQLKSFDINAVADVRSVPYSKVFFDYHQSALQKSLPAAGISYVFLGAELGPRSKDPNHYDSEGQVQFSRLQESALFKSGIQRLEDGLNKGLNIALMCAEKDPASCHRSLLVSHFLAARLDSDIQHIEHCGSLESQQALEKRLIQIQGVEADLVTPEEERLKIAYERQLKQTSYRK
ncbi:MAG: DUF488 family protein [Pseudohongiellaceae bacterium]